MPLYVSRSQYAIVLDVPWSLLCILVYHFMPSQTVHSSTRCRGIVLLSRLHEIRSSCHPQTDEQSRMVCRARSKRGHVAFPSPQ